MLTHLRRLGVVPVLLCALVACGDDDDGDAGTLTIVFDHTVDGAALSFGNTQYTNAAGNTYTVSNLEYIVSDLALKKANGTTFVLGSPTTATRGATRPPA